ncbi:thiol:disulfide interchange protein DsbG [Halomonas nitroreducens]|uniref:Thiol:disulfide interchange protein n=1 Tax=Halomonas nitroreducens TaxID=447425 RepID=A0A3S0JDB1_9GAMM|nr:thiol:disulfide interchange protein DsbG [Halomonas nitroreducens]RTR07178.1 thiol:disulfide interchange protein DsbG [Halomonas nitroreducens]
MLRLALTLAGLSLPLAAPAADWPAPIQALADQGLTIHERFEAPGGLTGFAASAQGREVAVYLTPDGEHAVVGNLVDAEGNNLSTAPLERLVRGPQDAETWASLSDSAWIPDGDASAERIIYVFTDPNCPYCRQFWQMARPWVEAGRVQLRHIMVGILEQDSPRLAISMLAAEDPAAALAAHESGDPIEPLQTLPRRWEMTLQENHELMRGMGLYATPSIFYRDGELVEVLQGLPEEEQFAEIMGSPEP